MPKGDPAGYLPNVKKARRAGKKMKGHMAKKMRRKKIAEMRAGY